MCWVFVEGVWVFLFVWCEVSVGRERWENMLANQSAIQKKKNKTQQNTKLEKKNKRERLRRWERMDRNLSEMWKKEKQERKNHGNLPLTSPFFFLFLCCFFVPVLVLGFFLFDFVCSLKVLTALICLQMLFGVLPSCLQVSQKVWFSRSCIDRAWNWNHHHGQENHSRIEPREKSPAANH